MDLLHHPAARRSSGWRWFLCLGRHGPGTLSLALHLRRQAGALGARRRDCPWSCSCASTTPSYNSPRFVYPALSAATILLVSVFFFRDSHNTHRWIRFGGFFTFQPSEIAKPMLIVFLAWFLHTRLDAMRDWKKHPASRRDHPVIFILLIVKQPDLGTALVLAGVTALMLVLAGMEWKYLIAGIGRRPSTPRYPVVLGLLAPGSACSSSFIPTPIPRARAFTSTSP